ncbi:hypothetical protein C8Q79DRAFT_961089 [Trametes meyenii]|nr:hypothetical protein C8Q79DRAFT_961089 [Trametes meyenii]
MLLMSSTTAALSWLTPTFSVALACAVASFHYHSLTPDSDKPGWYLLVPAECPAKVVPGVVLSEESDAAGRSPSCTWGQC